MEVRVADGHGYEYRHVQANAWMEFDCCRDCSHVDDAAYGNHFIVCPECGSRNVLVRVGRWHTYHPDLKFWQWLVQPILKDEAKAKFFLLKPEFRDAIARQAEPAGRE